MVYASLFALLIPSPLDLRASTGNNAIWFCGNSRNIVSSRFSDQSREKYLFTQSITVDQPLRSISVSRLGANDLGKNAWYINKKYFSFVSLSKPDLGGTAYLKNTGQLEHFPFHSLDPNQLDPDRHVPNYYSVFERHRVRGPILNIPLNFELYFKGSIHRDVIVMEDGSIDVFTRTCDSYRKPIGDRGKSQSFTLLHHRFKAKLGEEQYRESAADEFIVSNWKLMNTWGKAPNSDFQVGTTRDGIFLLTSRGRIFVSPKPTRQNSEKVNDGELVEIEIPYPVLFLIDDVEAGKSYAFTKSVVFEIARSPRFETHGLELTRPILVAQAAEQFVRCLRYLKK